MLIQNNPASIRRRIIGLPLLSPHLSPFADRITDYYLQYPWRTPLDFRWPKHTNKWCVRVYVCACVILYLSANCQRTAVSIQVIIIIASSEDVSRAYNLIYKFPIPWKPLDGSANSSKWTVDRAQRKTDHVCLTDMDQQNSLRVN